MIGYLESKEKQMAKKREKKDLKKYKTSKKKKGDLEELEDADGSPIEGDRNPTNDS